MFVAACREIRRHTEGERPEKDAAAPNESLEYSGSEHGAALPDRLYLLIFHGRPFYRVSKSLFASRMKYYLINLFSPEP